MNFQFYLEKLNSAEEFKKFRKENPSSFLCSAFFSIDKKAKDNKQHFDYFTKGKIFSFQLESDYKKIEIENYGCNIPKKISLKINFDFNEIEKIILEKMDKNKVKNNIQKFLLSLQNNGKSDFLIGTVFLSGMGMVNVKINLKEMKISHFEKKSIFDIMKIVKGK
jgi:hypothetical protein